MTTTEISRFLVGDFTSEDCIVDGEFTPEFLEFLKTDHVGKMCLKGIIRESKEKFVDEIIGFQKPMETKAFKAFMKPYIERFEKETGYEYSEAESEWRHCNDLAILRSTLKFDRGDTMCLLTVFEDRAGGNRVNMDVFIRNRQGVLSYWGYIDHCGCRAKLDEYFDRIISFCKEWQQ